MMIAGWALAFLFLGWTFDAKTGERRLAAMLPAGFHTIFRAAWNGDGRSLIVNRHKEISHIVLLENF